MHVSRRRRSDHVGKNRDVGRPRERRRHVKDISQRHITYVCIVYHRAWLSLTQGERSPHNVEARFKQRYKDLYMYNTRVYFAKKCCQIKT